MIAALAVRSILRIPWANVTLYCLQTRRTYTHQTTDKTTNHITTRHRSNTTVYGCVEHVAFAAITAVH
jgi:hypothetical protein